MASKPNLDDYVTVNERIEAFYAAYPEGSIQSGEPRIMEAPNKDGEIIPYLYLQAFAYRNPDDPRPGTGWAWEPLPGATPYTRGSELMVLETSAWGRALAALGFDVHRSVASREEVQNRQSNGNHPVNIEALNRTLKDMGVESPKLFVAEATGRPPVELSTLSKAAAVIAQWGNEAGIDDPVQELIERAANKNNPFHTEDGDWQQHEMEKGN